MPRKKRKSLIDELFGGSVFEDFDSLFEGFEKDKGGQSGYSISVSQTPQGTTVHAKVGKDTDVSMLKRPLQQQYSDAQIEIGGGQPLIREISTRPIQEKEDEETQEDP